MIDEKGIEKRQKRVFEIIKDYIKSDLLQKTWNTDGIIVINIYILTIDFIFQDFNE